MITKERYGRVKLSTIKRDFDQAAIDTLLSFGLAPDQARRLVDMLLSAGPLRAEELARIATDAAEPDIVRIDDDPRPIVFGQTEPEWHWPRRYIGPRK